MENFNLSIGKSNSTSNMVQISEFSVSVGSKKLFDNSELVIAPSNIYGFIGKNGCGKTTLLKMIANRELPINEKILILYVEQEIEDTEKTPIETLLESNGSFHKQQLRLNEIEEIMETDHFNEMEEEESDIIVNEYYKLEKELSTIVPEVEEVTVKKILMGLGFTELTMKQPCNLFSGGWKMRISLAKALYIQPDLLLLDEPTNHLDLEAVIWLGNYLETVFSVNKKMAVVVSHNVGFLNQVTSHTFNIEDGKIITYKGNYNSYKNNYNKKITNMDKEWNKILKKKKGKTKSEFEEIVKKSGLTEPPRPYEMKINFSDIAQYKGNIISIENLSFSYGDKKIFDNVNFGLDMDSRVTLVGKNGIGKSTLLKLIVGELEPNDGYISKQGGLKIGYYHQHFEHFLPKDKTPVEYLEYMVPPELISGNKMQTVRKYLGTVKLESQSHNSLIGSLSGGQKARVALVSLLFQQPHFILFDEPTNHLDIETVEALIEGLKNYEGGLMVITHEPELITNLESDLWILENNKIVFYNNTFDEYCDSLLT
jgi:ATP-binding cassette, subfamily F, member 1